jgi:hypothetical protein
VSYIAEAIQYASTTSELRVEVGNRIPELRLGFFPPTRLFSLYPTVANEALPIFLYFLIQALPGSTHEKEM